MTLLIKQGMLVRWTYFALPFALFSPFSPRLSAKKRKRQTERKRRRAEEEKIGREKERERNETKEEKEKERKDLRKGGKGMKKERERLCESGEKAGGREAHVCVSYESAQYVNSRWWPHQETCSPLSGAKSSFRPVRCSCFVTRSPRFVHTHTYTQIV